jgi:hypothetical protein
MRSGCGEILAKFALPRVLGHLTNGVMMGIHLF